jgi:hypothetical protein
MSSGDGDKMIQSKNGKMGVGNGYASDFLVINPHALKTNDKFTVKMGYESGSTEEVEVYRSDDKEGLRTWYQVDSTISDGKLRFQSDQGTLELSPPTPLSARYLSSLCVFSSSIDCCMHAHGCK